MNSKDFFVYLYMEIFNFTNHLKEDLLKSGVYKVKVTAKNSTNVYQLKIYCNDVVAAYWSLSPTYTQYTTSIGAAAGDVIAVKVFKDFTSTSGETAYVKDLYVCGTITPVSTSNIISITKA